MCVLLFFKMYIYVYEKQLGNLVVSLNGAVPPKIILIKSGKLMLAESLRKGYGKEILLCVESLDFLLS